METDFMYGRQQVSSHVEEFQP